jgi:hypothetical protein
LKTFLYYFCSRIRPAFWFVFCLCKMTCGRKANKMCIEIVMVFVRDILV